VVRKQATKATSVDHTVTEDDEPIHFTLADKEIPAWTRTEQFKDHVKGFNTAMVGHSTFTTKGKGRVTMNYKGPEIGVVGTTMKKLLPESCRVKADSEIKDLPLVKNVMVWGQNKVVAEECAYFNVSAGPTTVYRILGDGEYLMQSVKTLGDASDSMGTLSAKLHKSTHAFRVHVKAYEAVYIPAGFYVFEKIMENSINLRLTGIPAVDSTEAFELSKKHMSQVEVGDFDKLLAAIV
jgi:hypothetical protein